MGQPVADQELPHGQGFREVPGPDDPDRAGRTLEQPGAAGDEGAQDAVGQAGDGGDQPAQLGDGDRQDLAGFGDPGALEPPSTG